ncbi:hypothetical protein ACFFWD_04835 [Bradyrhizobium erythrophlei]|uniref:hypothetical protein n=1 Tax=Bradyrhizobium erythrophlei TaxID=1437360 RepID=UPI0035F09E70
MMLWLIVGMLMASTIVSGDGMRKLLKGNPADHVSAVTQQERLPQSPNGIVTD